MRKFSVVCFLFFCLFSVCAQGQFISAPEPQAATIIGAVTDTDDAVIPGATVTVDGPTPEDHSISTSTGDGSFVVNHLHPSVSYHVMVTAQGFTSWTSPAVSLSPGQQLDLADIKLTISAIETSVTAIDPEQLALEQIQNEEKQRVFGVFPNFYVAYDQQFVPLSAKLKYQLSYRAATDVISIAGAAVLAGIHQASDGKPNYVQGAKGYGQRFGAAYAGTVTDVFIGGAVLPSLLHQDPRYFYQGTGTKKSRALHAISAPFIAKGDNGRWQFNYSSIGGDLAAGAIANAYYPNQDRGAGLVFSSFALSTGGRIVNTLAQEFILRRVTSHSKGQN
jgi:Carboxypeptidase regulatory-like domain